ncbi:hypothetical protein KY290_009591 [Solanum tuberosum]|uniref:Uncharacterized protein n=1 Tax=Solanum tuberosum TaxID=4113 RepID=A0ABQ7VXE6_SOLTU|nr:hypothetical protein KY284_009517 [Solanum tuberosum]KAH0772454.1 hypothetical protein KY290_009591 [Solanum tuberosum]
MAMMFGITGLMTNYLGVSPRASKTTLRSFYWAIYSVPSSNGSNLSKHCQNYYCDFIWRLKNEEDQKDVEMADH